MNDMLVATSVTKRFRWRDAQRPWRRPWLTAVNDVSLRVAEGTCTALAGESGSGKTTLARCLLRLIEPDQGTVVIDGTDLSTLGRGQLRRRRREWQMVFQGTATALDPRLTVQAQIAEPLRIHRLTAGPATGQRVLALLDRVGLDGAMAARFPHQLSGGERQRVGIARALACQPRLLILDEPVSALDASVQAQILALLRDLQTQEGLTLLLISHDLAVIDQMADRVAVMYAGRVVEEGAWPTVLRHPRHPYTASLLAAVEGSTPRGTGDGAAAISAEDAVGMAGEVASPLSPPPGCAYHPRCPRAMDRCHRELPVWRSIDPATDPKGGVACHDPLTTYRGSTTAPSSAAGL